MKKIQTFLFRNLNILTIIFLLLFVIPISAHAQVQMQNPIQNNQAPFQNNQNLPSSTPQCDALIGGNINNFKDVIDWGICMITGSVVPLLFILAFVVFIYGVIQYFLNPNNIEERTKARKYIIFALVGMFVIFTLGGIIEIIRNTFGISSNTIPLLPETQ